MHWRGADRCFRGGCENRPLIRAAGLCFPCGWSVQLAQLLPSRPRSVFWRFARQQQIEIDGHIHAQTPPAARRAQAERKAGMAEMREQLTSESIGVAQRRLLEWYCLYTKKRPSEWPPGAFAF